MTYFAYLCGPISGLSYDEACQWRKDIRQLLSPSIICLDPMRDKQHFVQEKHFSGDHGYYTQTHSILSQPKSIFTRDKNDVRRSDILIANFLQTTHKTSIGSVMEIAWAEEWAIPVIAVIQEDNVHNHVMLVESFNFIVRTLKDAAFIANSLCGTYDQPPIICDKNIHNFYGVDGV
jgi:hypothetical protein